MAMPLGVLFAEPLNKPLSAAGVPIPNAVRIFYLTGTTTLANVYQDGALTSLFSQSPNPITADGSGRFPAIYLDPAITYRVQLWSAGQVTLLEDVDPYVPSISNGFYRAVKPANTSRVSTTSVTADPDLQIVIPSAGVWLVDAFIDATAAAAGANPGISYDIGSTAPVDGTKAAQWVANGNFNGTPATQSAVVNSGLGNSLNTGDNPIIIRAVVTTTAGGTIFFGWAQLASNVLPTTVLAGSTLTVQQIG